MQKKKNYHFPTEQLDALVEDVNSCITINNTTYSLALYPYHLSNVSESVKRLLNLMVAKYDQRLDGILLGYKNLKLITPYASLRADSCYIHVDIQGDFYLFKPKVGSLLTGSVNRISSNHIGCLVHEVFNVAVPNISEDESWPGYNIKVKDTLELSVIKIDLDGRLPYIQASIVSHTPCKKTRESPGNTPKNQRRKKIFSESSDVVNVTNESFSQEAEETLNSSTKKQKKKRLSKNENNNQTTEQTPNLNESTKKQKKKRLSQTENNIQTEETPKLNTPLSENSNKKKKKNKRNSDKIDDVDIKIEELSQKTLILNESQKKSNESTDTNKISPKKQKNQTANDSQHTNESDYFATPKIKKKQKQQPEKNKEQTPEVNLEKGSLEDFIPKEKKNKKPKIVNVDDTNTKNDSAKKKKDKRNSDINIEELQNNILMEQMKSLGSSKKEKKHKSKVTPKSEPKSINLSPIKPMADLEDRKIKNRRQSLSQTVNWENKELHLYDSDLEKTLNTPADSNNILDKSLQFNLAKIQALNADTPRKLKRKHKHAAEDEFVHSVKKSKIKD